MEVSNIVGFAHHSYIWRMSFASALKRLSGNRLDSFPFTVFRDEISCRGIWDFFTRLCYFFRRKLVIWKAWIFFGRTRLISKHRWCSGFWANPFVLLRFSAREFIVSYGVPLSLAEAFEMWVWIIIHKSLFSIFHWAIFIFFFVTLTHFRVLS